MPRYGYRCDTCGRDFDLVRPMRQSGEPGTCPEGHANARRTFGGVVTPGQAEELPSIEEVQAYHHSTAHGHSHGHAH